MNAWMCVYTCVYNNTHNNTCDEMHNKKSSDTGYESQKDRCHQRQNNKNRWQE